MGDLVVFRPTVPLYWLAPEPTAATCEPSGAAAWEPPLVVTPSAMSLISWFSYSFLPVSASVMTRSLLGVPPSCWVPVTTLS